MREMVVSIAAQNLWPMLLAAGGAVALLVLAFLCRLIVRTWRRDPLSRNPSTLTLSQQRALERDITGLINDLAEMARDVGRQLDARAERLEQLLREADERLEKLAGQPPRNDHVAKLDLENSIEPEVPDPRHVEIYTLADQGIAMHEIAQRLKRPSGEVELILALRPRRKQANA